MLADIAGELLGKAFRLIAAFLPEVVVDLLIRGPGYLVCRLFKKDIKPDGAVVLVVGLLFWGLALLVSYCAFLLMRSN